MKLTLSQITLLTEGTRKLVHQYTVLSESAAVTGQADMQTHWLNEAEEARQLVDTLNDALSIDVESVQLTPVTAVEAANPAFKQAFEKMNEVISASLAASPEHDLEGWTETTAVNAAMTQAPHPPFLAVPVAAAPTAPPSPSPRALLLASSLSKASLQMLVGFPPVPARILESRCNTIFNSRGETEPLAAQDLQAAARLLYQQRGYKPHLPPLTLAPGGCPESPAALHAAPAQTTASVQHPTKVSSLHLSSTQHGEACGDIHCDGNCPDPRAQPSTTVNHGQPASTPL
jgi:hypothetical protein